VDKITRNDVKKRIAVSGSAYDEFCGDRAASARSVVNDEWLAEALRQPLAYQARADIGCLAWGKADDDMHRSRRIDLRPGDPRNGRERGRNRCQMQKSTTGKFHGVPP
jgi:hypothetical protein